MGKFKLRDKNIKLSEITNFIDKKKFDILISKELLEANDWCSCSHTLDDQDPYNVIMGWCLDPEIYTDITDIDISNFFVYYDEDSENFIYMFDDIDIHTVKTVADLELVMAATCSKYEYLFDCPLCIMDNLFPDTPWNRYIGIVNTKIIELDNDPQSQFLYIKRQFHKMQQNKDFDPYNVLSWWKSQLQLIGKQDYLPDYAHLYTSQLDLSKLFKDLNIKKDEAVSKLIDNLNEVDDSSVDKKFKLQECIDYIKTQIL